MLVAVLLLIGCGKEDEPPLPSASPEDQTEATSQDSVLSVVDAYVREHTEEGSPYYIDSHPAEFEAIEEVSARPEGTAICRARFTSGADIFLLRFSLRKEIGSYIITHVVLDSMNAQPVGQTLYSRDSLVL